ACEERCLVDDPVQCTEARGILLNPKKRLAAELAWLPGMAPGRAREFVAKIASGDHAILDLLQVTNGLAFCNLSMSALKNRCIREDNVQRLVNDLIRTFESLEAEDLQELLNQEREAAGFSVIQDLDDITDAMSRLRKEYVDTLMLALDQL